MSRINNVIYVPSYGKDPKKFVSISTFEGVTKAVKFKKVLRNFRMAGKVKDYVQTHALAHHHFSSDWNGWGYDWQHHWYLLRPKDAAEVERMIADKASKSRRTRTDEEKKISWARSLSRWTGISVEDAMEIAEEKLEYKMEKIKELEDRQENRGYSVRRERLINKQWRSNPLRPIRDREHAFNILQASVSHNYSDYDTQLMIAKDMAENWELAPSEIQAYARDHTTYRGDISSVFFDNEEEGTE